MLSNFGIKFSIMPIFVDILDPPIIHVIGFSISDVTFFKALISEFNCIPEYDGKNFVILATEACALWEHEKASLTYNSANEDKCWAKSKLLFSSYG